MNGIDVQYPWALMLFLFIPIVISIRKKYKRTIGFSSIYFLADDLEPGPIKKYGPDIAGLLFITAAILAIANIQYASFWKEETLESKWILIVQDLSGSMGRPARQGSPLTLGDLALEGARSFISMRHQDDLLGVIAFSSFAKLVVPPTFDRRILQEKLKLLHRRSDSMLFREMSAGGATNASYATWLALNVFLMLLPQEHQLSFEEITDYRHALLGKTLKKIEVPDKLKKINFGHGMAIVLFTDGRIGTNSSYADVNKGLPNFVNVIKLLNKLKIKLYIIVIGDQVTDEIKIFFQKTGDKMGRIFYMPRYVLTEHIKVVYDAIHALEKNKLLVKLSRKKKDTRGFLLWLGFFFLVCFCFMGITPWFKKIV